MDPHSDWLVPDWPAPPRVRALVTTRRGGVSTGSWASMNLGAHCGDDPGNVKANRQRLRACVPEEPLWLQQVHGKRVLRHPGIQGGEALPDADGSVTSKPGRVCAVLTADCLPVLICNRAGDRVAAAHAGWRGLASGVLEAAVKALGAEPLDLLAWLGPAIGPQAYEVGADVVAAFSDDYPAGFRESGDSWLMDLYELARRRLARAGVEAIFGGGYCTMSEPDCFFSYRRDGVTGRMASLVWIET
jgi:YfiH family protein